MLNAFYIEMVESFPDTTISLSNGHKYVVKESVEETVSMVEKFYRSVNLLGHQQLEGLDNEEK